MNNFKRTYITSNLLKTTGVCIPYAVLKYIKVIAWCCKYFVGVRYNRKGTL